MGYVVTKAVKAAMYRVFGRSAERAVLDSAQAAVVSYYRQRELPLAVKAVVADVLDLAGTYGQHVSASSGEYVARSLQVA